MEGKGWWREVRFVGVEGVRRLNVQPNGIETLSGWSQLLIRACVCVARGPASGGKG